MYWQHETNTSQSSTLQYNLYYKYVEWRYQQFSRYSVSWSCKFALLMQQKSYTTLVSILDEHIDWVSRYTRVSIVLYSTTPSTLRFHVECKPVSWEWAWPPFLFCMQCLTYMHRNWNTTLGIKECLDETLWNPNMYNCHSIPGRIDNSAQIYDIQSINSNIELNFPHRFL